MDLSAIALQGVEQGQVQLENAAARLAGAGADSPDGAGLDTVELSAEIVALMAAQNQFSANLSTLISSMSSPILDEHLLTVERVFELANKAHFLYVTRNSVERGELLKTVLLNCATDGTNLWPTYRKPFDLIFQRAENEEWSGRADLNCRPLAPQASALPG